MFGYLCFFQIIGMVVSKICYYYIDYDSYYSSNYCSRGCCSKYKTNPCCSSSYFDWSSAETIGAVVGGLFALSIFVSIISYICKRMRAQRGVQGQVLSPPAVTYITTTGGAVPNSYPQAANQPQFGSNMNIMGSTEQLNVIPPNNGNTAYLPSNGNTAYPTTIGNTAYPPSNGNTTYPPSYDNLAHDHVKGAESSMNACT
ncbi:unnamed protein product [Mytilus edulis]|uniref:Uncharacterized protein n=1 Tax=Mytilus edulis TaxID=6550 RepID=A0A8S3VDL6_MYTED|nr:unnamed protein product [Mytilus edulis]